MGGGNRNRAPPMADMGIFGTPPPGRRTGRNVQPEFPPSPFGPLFSAIFSNMNNVQAMNHGQAGMGGGQYMPTHPIVLLQQLLNPQNAAHGDAVFSQEALDRVISQLMEQNRGSNAPGPAPEEAIQALPKRAVEPDMLGSDGKAECSICMENVDIGEEVTFLPCNHWFHGTCVSAWLKEHDTCPHCRQSITKHSEQSEGNQPEGSGPAGDPRRPSRRHSSFGSSWRSQPDRTPRPNGAIPEDATSEDVDQYYDEMSPPGSTHSRRFSRTQSNSNRSRSASGGGVSGWIRNHNPFSSGSS